MKFIHGSLRATAVARSSRTRATNAVLCAVVVGVVACALASASCGGSEPAPSLPQVIQVAAPPTIETGPAGAQGPNPPPPAESAQLPPDPVPTAETTADVSSAPRQMFGAKHLLVFYQGARRAPAEVTRTKEEARRRAAEAAEMARRPGAKFEQVVAKYTEEPGGAGRGGDLGQFPQNAMVPEFQSALEKLRVGEIRDVVETPFGST